VVRFPVAMLACHLLLWGGCAGEEVECRTDEDCLPGYICDSAGTCWKLSTDDCTLDDDCDPGYVCVDSKCQEEPHDLGKMVNIPAGSFMMGCNEAVDSECDPDEFPYHSIDLLAFKIDETEVFQEAYKLCMDDGACLMPGTDEACHWDPDNRGRHPVVCVTWLQARAFCTWADKRLPTEAEWEKAARGEDGLVYPWGNTAPDCTLANFEDCNADNLEVGSIAGGASPYGALDMAGNVWEWVNDYYDENYYPDSPAENPQGPASGTNRVMRGGGFGYAPNYMRTSNRGGNEEDMYRTPLGFRCAK